MPAMWVFAEPGEMKSTVPISVSGAGPGAGVVRRPRAAARDGASWLRLSRPGLSRPGPWRIAIAFGRDSGFGGFLDPSHFPGAGSFYLIGLSLFAEALGAAAVTSVTALGAFTWTDSENMGSPDAPDGALWWVMTLCYAPLLAWGPLLGAVHRGVRAASVARRRGGTRTTRANEDEGNSTVEWRCAGLGWPDGRPVLRWAGGRRSALPYGKAIGFRAVGERRCVGARGNPCPHRAVVPGRTTQARCPECARLDRAFSVAADGVPDDPRTYRVYLAWFGPGLLKVGITAQERGSARLLEQGAVAFCWLGRGPLMAARRTEELLRSALGVPDRVSYDKKRSVRTALPERAERAGELAELHRRAVALDGWAETLERVAFEAVDHAEAFGLPGLRAATGVRAVTGFRASTGVVRELVDGGTVAGRLVAAAGPDLYLAGAGAEAAEGAGGVFVVDARVLVGWELARADAGAGVTVPVRAVPDGGGGGSGAEQEGLF